MGHPPTSHHHESLELDPGASVRALEDGARDALLLFLSQAPYWGKLELVTWLTREYADATILGAERGAEPPADHRGHLVDMCRLHDLLVDVQRRVSALDVETDGLAVVAELERANVIVRVHDRRGDIGWAAVDAPGLDLYTRVLALWAIDALGELHPIRSTRPGTLGAPHSSHASHAAH